MAMPQSIQLSGQALSGGGERVVDGNTLVHSAIGTGPQWLETESSQLQCLSPLSYWDRHSVAMP